MRLRRNRSSRASLSPSVVNHDVASRALSLLKDPFIGVRYFVLDGTDRPTHQAQGCMIGATSPRETGNSTTRSYANLRSAQTLHDAARVVRR
jgi:hypothetical protein